MATFTLIKKNLEPYFWAKSFWNIEIDYSHLQGLQPCAESFSTDPESAKSWEQNLWTNVTGRIEERWRRDGDEPTKRNLEKLLRVLGGGLPLLTNLYKVLSGKKYKQKPRLSKTILFQRSGLLRRLSLREKAGEMGSDSLSNSTTLGHKPNSGLSDTTRDDEAKCVPGKVERTESGVLPARGSWLWVSARLLELQTQVHRVSKAEDDTSEHVRSLAWEARSDHRQNCRQREPP